jgi:hypothetical protein
MICAGRWPRCAPTGRCGDAFPRAPERNVRDVVGSLCAFCRQPIADTNEGHLCEGCRNPLHYDCARPRVTSGRGVCAVCGINLTTLAAERQAGRDRTDPRDDGRVGPVQYTEYYQVPWYRRSWVNNLFVALALFGCLPLAFWTCFNLLSGDVYFDRQNEDGTLAKWGIVNKVWAFLFAIGWTFILSMTCLSSLIGGAGK